MIDSTTFKFTSANGVVMESLNVSGKLSGLRYVMLLVPRQIVSDRTGGGRSHCSLDDIETMTKHLLPWLVTYVRTHPVKSRLTLEHIDLPQAVPMYEAIHWAKELGEQTLPGWKFESVERPR